MGAWHPDLLLDSLTWEQWQGWEQAYMQDPWGELRADMRASINTLHGQGGGENVSPMWPYYGDTESMGEQMEEMAARAAKAKDDPAFQEKMRKSRDAYLAAKAKKNGG